ncbi:MAG TPA: hypothetical protein VEV38_13465 [Candidatus Eremiobacteraceae bacterium]|nr:hypothetical protein [Candidatus Eremiobacteraceae bacterium]
MSPFKAGIALSLSALIPALPTALNTSAPLAFRTLVTIERSARGSYATAIAGHPTKPSTIYDDFARYKTKTSSIAVIAADPGAPFGAVAVAIDAAIQGGWTQVWAAAPRVRAREPSDVRTVVMLNCLPRPKSSEEVDHIDDRTPIDIEVLRSHGYIVDSAPVARDQLVAVLGKTVAKHNADTGRYQKLVFLETTEATEWADVFFAADAARSTNAGDLVFVMNLSGHEFSLLTCRRT